MPPQRPDSPPDASGPAVPAAGAAATSPAAGRSLPAAVAVLAALLSGAFAAAQGAVNGGLAERVGTPVLAALISNGLATVLLALAACALPQVRAGLRRLPGSGLRWWHYLGGTCGALFVAGSALTVPVLGVALVTVVQVCGTSIGGVLTDRAGLGPTGRLPVTPVRVLSALLAVAAVGVAQLGRPVGHWAVGLVGLVLLLGLGLSVQSALNGRVNLVARNVGSASLVNALVGTTVLSVAGAGFAVTGHLPVADLPADWWLYLGGVFSPVVTGGTLVGVRSLGVLRTGLAFIAGQLTGGLLLDTFVPGLVRPSGWLLVGAALIVLAILLSGASTADSGWTRWPGPRRRRADSKV